MKTYDIGQRTEEWFACRQGLPTASNFSSILSPVKATPSAAQKTLIAELVAEALLPGAPDGLIPSGPMTYDMIHGMQMEDEARKAYAFETGLDARLVGFCEHDSGRFGCSPDAIVGEDGGTEIKCPALKTHIGWLLDGGLPDEHKLQVHGSLIVTGRAWWDFWSYSRMAPPLRVRVVPDEFTAKLAHELNRFCDKLDAARARFGLPPLAQRRTTPAT